MFFWKKRRPVRLARTSRPNRLGRNFSLEPLEARRLMAVTTSVVGGELRIIGDTADDQIQVSSTVPGTWNIQGLNGTEVDTVANGSTDRAGVTRILIDMGDGADQVRITEGTVTGPVIINMGIGADVLTMGVTGAVGTGATLTIDLGADANTLTMDNTNADGNLTIIGGAAVDTINIGVTAPVTTGADFSLTTTDGTNADGNDTVVIQDLVAGGDITIITGFGNDTVTLGTLGLVDPGGDLTVDLGDGDDTVNYGGGASIEGDVNFIGGLGNDTMLLATFDTIFVAGDINMNGGNLAFNNTDGNDVMRIGSAFASGRIDIFGGFGPGNDTFTAFGVISCGGDLIIEMGDGNDSVSVFAAFIVGDIVISTGLGNDNIDLSNSSTQQSIFVDDSFFGVAQTVNTNFIDVFGCVAAGVLEVTGTGGRNFVDVSFSAATAGITVDFADARNNISVSTNYTAGYLVVAAGQYVNPLIGGVVRLDLASIVDVTFNQVGGLQVYGSAGADQIFLYANFVTARTVFVDAGLGQDLVAADYNIFLFDFQVSLNGGDDFIQLLANQVRIGIFLDGGIGQNQLAILDNLTPTIVAANFLNLNNTGGGGAVGSGRLNLGRR